MALRFAVALLPVIVGLAACATTEAEDTKDSNDAAQVCELTLTRVRCAGSCDSAFRQQTFSEVPAQGGCGGNAQSGCLVENATGDFYSSPTTSYFAEVLTKFQACTPAQAEQLRAPSDAGNDGGDSSEGDATAPIDDAAGLCHEAELTRAVCALPGDCPPKVLTETSCSAVRSAATYCWAEIASGDLYTQWAGEPLEDTAGRLRGCDEAEEQRWVEARSSYH